MTASGCNLAHLLRTCGLVLPLALQSCAPKEHVQGSVGTGGSAEAAGADAAGDSPAGGTGIGGSVVVVETGTPDGGADATSSSSDAGPPESACSVTPLERIAPVLMVLLDQSGSMAQNFDGAATRWTRLVDALTAQDSPLRLLDQELQIGLTAFTSNGGFGSNPVSPRTCPMLKSVATAVGNFSTVQELLESIGPTGDSPGAESLTAVAQQLAAAGNVAPASILWIIDGTDTCEDASLEDETITTPLSVQALNNAFQLGIHTQILTVGNDTSDTALHQLASAGAGGDPDAQGFRPATAVELAAALATAVENVRSCELRLPEPLAASAASSARVRLGDTELARGAGWESSDRTLRLLGAACAALKTNPLPVTLERCGTR